MATELKRMTFAVTPDMEELMDEAKRMFYDSTQSEIFGRSLWQDWPLLKQKRRQAKMTVQHDPNNHKVGRARNWYFQRTKYHAFLSLLNRLPPNRDSDKPKYLPL